MSAQKKKKTPGKSENDEFINSSTLLNKYGITKKMAGRFLPAPKIRKTGEKVWRRLDVISCIDTNPELRKVIHNRSQDLARNVKNNTEKLQKDKDEISFLLNQYGLPYFLDIARGMERKFVLHIGPTNSGKTFQAIQAMKESGKGVYLGPLRLLALEMFDSLNKEGYPCTLLTGEEAEYVPCSRYVASTIEMCDYSEEYDVAVIDEAQLLADPERGAHWTKAILCVKAKEVHICAAPEAENIICEILFRAGATWEIVRHERMTPLIYNGTLKSFKNVRPGDALITFSRKEVLAIAASLEEHGIRASVIYGALPPAARREEVAKFTSGENTVVVATDAIGMGISLPIKRVIFCRTRKFDGTSNRLLTPAEVKQIAGRAGRYGIYDKGEVLVLSSENPSIIKMALQMSSLEINKIVIPFPSSAIHSDFSIPRLLKAWQNIPKDDSCVRANMSVPLELYSHLGPIVNQLSKDLVFKIINCPMDTGASGLLTYWLSCCKAIADNLPLPLPAFGTNTLAACELQYRGYDIRYHLLRALRVKESRTEEMNHILQKINEFLAADKSAYIRRCSVCNKPLPFDYEFGMCEECYEDNYGSNYSWRYY